MCYRFDNYIEIEGGLVNKYKLRLSERHEALRKFARRYSFCHTNGFAHEEIPVFTMQMPEQAQGYTWGLIPHWVKAKEGKTALKMALETRELTLNATCENVFIKPSFKPYIKTRRCLVPATGFFEWHHKSKTDKVPYHIMVKDYEDPTARRAFYFGGLYSTWVDPDGGEVYNTFSIVTTPANEKMEFVHNSKKRMPLILHSFDEEKWLDPKLSEEQLNQLMKPFPNEYLAAYTIGKRITDRNINPDSPETLEPSLYEGMPVWE
ncbi:MAG: SOS response-associated peptidase [Chitinophagales bacterium]